jgi:hypothetical protein
MADARERASGGRESASARPTRLRVMRADIQDLLRSPRRSRLKKHPAPLPSPPPPPPQQEDKFDLARYDCAFQDEREGSRDSAPPDLVWGKVRSHPWWPGQVFDPADASEVALQHRRPGAPLVAYFWDRTFAWNDASALRPFSANFARFSAQSTMSGFVSAVDAALQEVGRRVEAGLSCTCSGSTISTKQEVENSGVRHGAYGAVVDTRYMRGAFNGKTFLHYISALGKRPLAGADLLDLATAKAQLRAFNRSRGPRGLPEFVLFEGIEDDADAVPNTKRKMMHKSNEKKSRLAGSSLRRSRGATDEDTTGKGNNSKRAKSSAKKETDVPKHSDGCETAADVGGSSRTPANNAVDNVLNGSKSVRTLRSMSKMEDALKGLKKLGKGGGGGGGETSAGNSKDVPLLKQNKLTHTASAASHKKDKITEDEDGLGEGSTKDSTSLGKRSSGRTENSVSKRLLTSEHSRKKKKLSELMAETGRPKARGTPLHVSAVKAEDPGPDSKDISTTSKRKKLNTLGDLSPQSQPISRKKSTKVGELTIKASGRTSRTPPAVKTDGTTSQSKLHSAKHKHVCASVKSPRSAKVDRGKKDAITDEPLSCGEMLMQLSLAACDLEEREKIAPTSVNFFTGFKKNSNASSCDVYRELPEKACDTESAAPSEQPIADHMQDDYWADILINVEEPLSSLKKKDDSKKRSRKKAHQVKKSLNNSSVTLASAGKSRSGNKQDTENGEHPKHESKPAEEEIENSLLAGLVLHFSRPSAVPSRSDLIKIFSQYGPVKEAKADNANSAEVIFKRRVDAEAAFAGAGKISALGPALDSFRLLPAGGSENERIKE